MDLYRGRKYCFGVYHTTGLQCLRQCKHLTADQVLRAAGALLRMQDICRDHLLFPADYVLSMDTLYAKRDYTEMQLLFIPTDKDRMENPHKRLLTLLQSMKRLTSPCGADYLAALQELLQMRSCGNEQVLGSLQQWRRRSQSVGCAETHADAPITPLLEKKYGHKPRQVYIDICKIDL